MYCYTKTGFSVHSSTFKKVYIGPRMSYSHIYINGEMHGIVTGISHRFGIPSGFYDYVQQLF